MANSFSAFNRLREDFFRYYNTPFKVRLEGMMEERTALLDKEGMTWREPWVELIRTYKTTGQGKKQAIETAGGSEDLVELINCGLFDETIEDIYLHQKQTLEDSLKGRNVVVSSGTGSGKTESFLLPIFSKLLEESKNWEGSSPAGDHWWESDNSGWVAQREKETGRKAAIRALVMYPMNALVEDQMVRLRIALDSEKARTWMDDNRAGHRFYFGRYTSKTPVAGSSGDKRRVPALRALMRDLYSRAASATNDEERRPYVSQFDGSEMLSRWDMQEHPPDIFISNYSMLNIMLMRKNEESFLKKTREWLEEDSSHVFHLVVDELHMYRGTMGAEVAYLIRRLFMSWV